MAKPWREATIEDVSEKVAMGPFGSSIKIETFVDDGVPVISGQHLHGSMVDDQLGFNFITEEHARKLQNANVRRGDIIFTHAGNIGQVAYISSNSIYDRYVISQRQFYMRCDRSQVLPEFVVSYFKTPEGQHKLLANTSQTGVPSIAQPVSYLRTITIPVPPLEEQRAIAHILGTLDDKIELNRRMSETLESMARALFKSWFVDFEPVRAKMERRNPGLSQSIADLFPARLVDSEFGEIPEGWKVVTLGDIAETVNGRSYKSADLEESNTALVTLRSFARGGGYRPDGLKAYTGTYRPEQVVRPGEVVVACTDVTQAAEVIGRPAIVQPTSRYNTLVASLDTAIVRPTGDSVGCAFLYCLMRTDQFVDHTLAHTTGTTVLHLAKNAIPSFSFACPPQEIVDRFQSISQSALERVRLIGKESETLADVRDTLLPKLISGELRVKDTEKMIGRAE